MQVDVEKLKINSVANKAGRELSVKVNSYLEEKLNDIFEFPEQELSRRIRQTIFGLGPYLSSLFRSVSKEEIPEGKLKLCLNESDLIFEESTRFELVVGSKVFLRNLFQFTKIIIGTMFYVLKSLFISKEKLSNISLVLNPNLECFLSEDKVMEEFHDYCFEGKFDFLKESGLVICRGVKNQKSKDGKLVMTTENVFAETLRHVDYSLLDVIKMTLELIKVSISFYFRSITFPPIVLLAKDFAFLPLMRLLNGSNQIGNIVLNTSFMYNQELWLHFLKGRNFKVRMIWYGMSVKQLRFQGVQHVEPPAFELFHVENNYVWNEYHKREVQEELGFSGNIYITGSTMWYIPKLKKIDRSTKKVVIFFNNPKSYEKMKSVWSEKFFYYGCYEIQEKFYNDIVSILRQLEKERGCKIDIVVKLKRGYDYSDYDNRLKNLVHKMEEDGCRLFDVESVEGGDVHNEVYNSDLVICTPMSTPNFLASELGVPALYYDPVNLVQPSDLEEYGIGWASSKEMARGAIESTVIGA